VYKLLLCWRYLRTRFLALICIVSVTLGVATLIVVNSVMSGFSEKLRDKLHQLLADVVIESTGLEGFRDPDEKMRRIKGDPFLASRIEAMSASMECFAMLQYEYPGGGRQTRTVRLIGVDPETRAELGGFKGCLMNVAKRDRGDFALPPHIERFWRERDKIEMEMQRMREGVPPAAIRKLEAKAEPAPVQPPQPPQAVAPDNIPPPMPPPFPDAEEGNAPPGIIVGNLIAGFRRTNPETNQPETVYVMHPGDQAVLITVKGSKLEPVYDRFVIVDYFKTDMSEYDGNLVFVDLKYLQQMRAADDTVTTIQIKLKDYADAPAVVAKLNSLFPVDFRIQTWEQKQGPLLAAIDIEKGVLNVLLFLIVAVAGFGILAIFSMIVAEKTRDIGIMKSLGASNLGVMQIFLSYGLLLGIVGGTIGTALGITITVYLNPIEKFLTKITGRHIFDPNIYYFTEIPTNIESLTVVLVNLGAVAIAVAFSILPALRAAMLHPVRALRFE
jgi:lipoprotein-releasing system permease protein